MRWSPDAEDVLRRRWSENVSAADIGSELGVSRNAVVSKAKRLGLLRSKGPLPVDDITLVDPIFALAGASTTVQALQRWRWPGNGGRYVNRDLSRVLDVATTLAGERATEIPEVNSFDLVSAILLTPFDANISGALKKVSRHLRNSGIDLTARARDIAKMPAMKRPEAKLLWDAVAVLTESAAIRSRTMAGRGPTDYCHVMGALLASHIGRKAVGELLGPDLAGEPFRQAVTDMLTDPTLRRGPVEGWQSEIARIDAIPPAPSQQRAGYTSDQVRAGGDVFGTSTDAKALADLILLEAAEPPLAIGVFGSWGSGKSTLIAELQHEIDRKIGLTSARIDDEVADDADLARVTGVMQLEFNAWTFADSENLWASLTAELFDQIAAGGGGAQRDAERGALLVKEVAARVSREASALTLAKMQLEESETEIVSALEAVQAAKAKIGGAGAIIQSMLDGFDDMLDTAAEDSDKKGGAKQETKSDTAIGVVRQALLVDPGLPGARLAEKYAEAASPMRQFLIFAGTWFKSQTGIRRLSIALSGFALCIAFGIMAAVFVTQSQGPFDGYLAWASGVLLTMAPLGYAARKVVLPLWRGAALFQEKYENARTKNMAALKAARKKLRESEQSKIDAKEQIERGMPILERYGQAADGASPPPGLMLEYLLRDSADVTELRGRLGTLGMVRRCFWQLNHIIQQMRSSGEVNGLERIVIYIDDLDRCSEKQVVQVLEAIHLMLAFPCFVVVAAVDARWLESALRSQHQAMTNEDSSITPADYLEKIFQIPFWVRTLSRGSADGAPYVDYIRALLRLDDEQPDEEEEDDAEGFEPAPLDFRSGAFPRLEPLRSSAAELEATSSRQLKLTIEEARLIEAMHPIAARSPRAVKRMVNIYRLIRVSVAEHLLEDYLKVGEDIAPYWAVILVLAWETGLRPSEMSALARGIRSIEATDVTELVGWAHSVYNDEVLEEVSLASVEVLELVRSPARDALRSGLFILSSSGISVRQTHLLRALDLVSRYSFRLDKT
ncbi:P-loop NTPase fold protein [Erythrobacter sp. G21629-S1]|nr:P-loop NTPase fold protein [Erythrobacter sp. G21629-S1]